jgi:hypothetical protein
LKIDQAIQQDDGHHRCRVGRVFEQIEVSAEKEADKKRRSDTFEK